MKQVLAATALLSTLAAATPQQYGSNHGGNWGNGAGPFAAFPSCVSSCRDQSQNWANADSLCTDSTAITNLNNCVNSSTCSDQEKNDVRQAIAQLCVNAGATITAAPFASYSVTSGKWINTDGMPSQWSSWASANGVSSWPTATSEWASWASANNLPTATGDWGAWASAHSSGGWNGHGAPGPWATGGDWSSAASEFSSWTAANTITSLPTAASQWSSFTSAYPLPSGLSSFGDWAGANGFPGGSAWPTSWTTNSAWASAVSAWGGNVGGGPMGWHGGMGPFGSGGPGGNGWGPGAWGSSGAWTSGPWTSWWGTSGCPASTWSGWTDGPWSTSAPWTAWSGCVASTTASAVYTTTEFTNGASITAVSTSFGIQVAEQTNALTSTTVSTTNSDSGAMPTNMAFAGSAAGVIGVVAGALLL